MQANAARSTLVTAKPPIYLDYNATAPLWPEARDAMLAALEETGNPSSVHKAGQRARARVEAARTTLGGLLGCRPRDLVFTSGGTEANALALAGAPVARRLVSAVEHDSVRQTAGASIVAVDENGRIDLAALDRALAAGDTPALVSVMAASNETGVAQPIDEVAALTRRHGALLHVDAVQAFGKRPLDLAAIGADLVSLSAHKLGGPMGAGALYVRPTLALGALFSGGGQELGRRAGTENVAGVAGFAAAAEALCGDGGWRARALALRERLEAALAAAGGAVHAREAERLCNTVSVRMPGVAASTQLMAFDLAGFAVSAGAACSSGKVGPSATLLAMGLSEAAAGQSVRVSLGWLTSADEIDAFAACWRATASRLARSAA